MLPKLPIRTFCCMFRASAFFSQCRTQNLSFVLFIDSATSLFLYCESESNELIDSIPFSESGLHLLHGVYPLFIASLYSIRIGLSFI